jgi:hypothetical protein
MYAITGVIGKVGGALERAGDRRHVRPLRLDIPGVRLGAVIALTERSIADHSRAISTLQAESPSRPRFRRPLNLVSPGMPYVG